MAGTAKPNIIGLGKEVNSSIIGSSGLIGYASGLFDGAQVDQWNSSQVCYWNGIDFPGCYMELLIPRMCNIWRSGTTSWIDHRSPFIILKYKGSSYVDVTSLYPQTVTAINNTKWEKTISNLPAGQYRFSTSGRRLDSEWYLEEVNINKYLIKQGDNYYSIKDNTITQLGAPTDDTQKEQWFDDYGVEDLKDALLTPDTNGNKLIDSLDNQFEVRMMKAK